MFQNNVVLRSTRFASERIGLNVSARPFASISIDLDNKWAYLRTAKKSSWETFPTYLPTVVPRIVSYLARADFAATIFVVGRDLLDDRNVRPIRDLYSAGHSIGNHSFEHEPWLHVFDQGRVEKEVCETHELIRDRVGTTPIGFRGPGYSDSTQVHEKLIEQKYRYCASAFPSSVGPLARGFYLLRTGLRRDAERAEMFGSWTDAFQKNVPYEMTEANGKLWMLPVTTQPFTRLPFHFTYLFYLSEYSPALARSYFLNTLRLCRITGVPPSLLLHPLDFLGREDEPELSFFPGMRLSKDAKLEQLEWFMKALSSRFEVLTMERYLDRIDGQTPEKKVKEIRTLPLQ